jgi:post-segregation antitoxin (ccd killing protein)
MSYTAVIIDENGADHGPVDISNAQNDAQARDLAKQAGMKWLADNGAKRATVQISRNSYGLSVEVHA